MRNFIPAAATLLLALSNAASGAEAVYKCMKDGKASYTANPRSSDGECQETKIEEQNPEDFARAMEEKRLRQEVERRADEQRLKEREIRAKEQEAAASARRARALEEQLLLQRQSPQVIYPETVYPYWWGGGFRPIRPLPPAGGQPPPPPRRSPPAAIQIQPAPAGRGTGR